MPSNISYKVFDTEEVNFTPGERSMVAWISTDQVDHEGDVVVAEGIDYRSVFLGNTPDEGNPVVLASHDYGRWPLGKCEWIKLKRSRDFTGLYAKTVFDDDEDAEKVWKKIRSRTLRGVSIGFVPPEDLKPGEWGPPTADELRRRPDWFGAERVIRRCVLLEYSCCSIPMNPGALVIAAAKGIHRPVYSDNVNGRKTVTKPYPGVDIGLKAMDDDESTPEVTSADARVMVGLWIAPEVASKIAIPDGEPPDQLHATLCYLGRAIEIGTNSIEDVKRICQDIATWCPPLNGTIGGMGRFSASPTSDGKDVIYASLDLPNLAELRQNLTQILTWNGIKFSKAHGFTPHVTLAYVNPDEDSPVDRIDPIPVVFNDLCLCVEGEKTAFRFGGGSSFVGDNIIYRSVSSMTKKGVIPHHKSPVVDSAWDAAAAKQRVAKWASSDGSGDKDMIAWAKYKQAFLWVGEPDDEITSYKLPIKDVKDGELVTVKAALHAVASVLGGGRGGVDIPDGDKAKVKSVLDAYYKDAGEDPPSDKSADADLPRLDVLAKGDDGEDDMETMGFKKGHHVMMSGGTSGATCACIRSIHKSGKHKMDEDDEDSDVYEASEDDPVAKCEMHNAKCEPTGKVKCVKCKSLKPYKKKAEDDEEVEDKATATRKEDDEEEEDEDKASTKSSHPHFIKKCSCGAVIAQCRCMSPDKRVEIIPYGCEACKSKKAMGEGSGGTGGFGIDDDTQPLADRPSDGDADGDDLPADGILLRRGDHVAINGEGHKGYGVVMSVHKDGDFVPHVDQDVVGTEDSPAARVRRYKSMSDGFVATDCYSGHKCKHLTKVEGGLKPPTPKKSAVRPASPDPIELPPLPLPSLEGAKTAQDVNNEVLLHAVGRLIDDAFAVHRHGRV